MNTGFLLQKKKISRGFCITPNHEYNEVIIKKFLCNSAFNREEIALCGNSNLVPQQPLYRVRFFVKVIINSNLQISEK